MDRFKDFFRKLSRRSHHYVSETRKPQEIPPSPVEDGDTLFATPSTGDVENSPNDSESTEYWQNTFLDFEGAPFPAHSIPTESLEPDSELLYEFPLIPTQASNIALLSKTYAAWALVISQLTNSTDVVFGSTVIGSEEEAERSQIFPIRIRLTANQTVEDYLSAIQQYVRSMKPFEHTGLMQVAKSCAEAERACMFQTLFIISSCERYAFQTGNLAKREWAQNRALRIEIHFSSNKASLYGAFDSRVISQWMVKQLLQRLEFAMNSLEKDEPKKYIGDIDMVSGRDLEEIWKWNDSVPEAIHVSVVETIEKRAMLQPESLAVSAWDGELTYDELNHLAFQLATRLINHPSGVVPGKIIPLCFHKSMWTVVAMLGVLKSGAAFVLLDPFLPEERLRSIVQQTNADLILCSATNESVSSRLAQEVLMVVPDLFVSKDSLPYQELPHPNAESLMYAVFTSGTTGTPKGVTITHQNHASALHYQTDVMGLTSTSRIYDFSAYSFDLSIFNTFSALTIGGCLCVPSEENRRDRLAESITSFRANWIYLTPTVARQLSPTELPYLESLVLIGEAVNIRDLAPWKDKIRIINTYGPSECTTASTINSVASTMEQATQIGKGAGTNTWVVNPENHNLLMPLGCIGELLLEGPLVGRGYLGEPTKTTASFINDPAWLVRGLPSKSGRIGRLYKTGDLVRYNNDGSLSFVGRKDNQVKIHGNRVELGEIEFRVQESIMDAVHVVAEMILPQNSSPVLAVFIRMKPDEADSMATSSAIPTLFSISTEAKSKIATYLPSYMVPNIYLKMNELPLTASGKTDRKRLREIGGTFSLQYLLQLHSKSPPKETETEIEHRLRNLWSQILGIEASSIGLNDNFLQLGGDSLSAMCLVAEARKIGLQLTVADIMRQPVLEDIANQTIWITDNSKSEEAIRPFALLSTTINVGSLIQYLSSQYQVDPSKIKDVYPCTPLQEGLLSLSSKSGDYVMQGVLEISNDVDFVAFKRAWEELFRNVAILRTRIVHHKSYGLLQMELDEPIKWSFTATKSLEEYLAADKEKKMEVGQPLTRFAFLNDDEGTAKWMIWTIHHSLYDEWSLSLLLNTASRIYNGAAVESIPPLQSFIKYIQDQDQETMASYWRESLHECDAALFPDSPPSIEEPVVDSIIEEPLNRSYVQPHSSNVTISTMIRGAWAMIASRMTNSDDVVFGTTISGRSAPVAGIYTVPAPTIATVPVRINIISRDQKISEFLAAIQKQSTDMIPFEQMGLHHIAKISSDTKHACGFQTLLVIQPNDNDYTETIFGKWQFGGTQQSFNTYGLILEILLKPKSITARARFDSRVIQSWVVRNMLKQLDFVMAQLNNGDKLLKEIEIATPQDLEQIWKWNSVLPAATEACIPELIQERSRIQPNEMAVCAWDGEITYGELTTLATTLAALLTGLDVGPGVLVPIYFEKSMWTTVAILAVLMAGGGFVLLDPYLPQQRLKEIVRQIKAKIILSSVLNEQISKRLTDHVVAVDSNLLANLGPTTKDFGKVEPSSTAYVLFTSGSMGLPKGVVITHRNVASAVPEHIKRLGYTSDSRIYDFASYSFGAAINNVMAALISGACLCVPSDNDRRSNLAGSLVSLRATVVLLTPSVAENLSPENVPTLRSIIFGGEAVRMKDVVPWWGHVKVITAYGSSEVTTISTINYDADDPEEITRIGKGVGGVTWVVDPDNHDYLLPPGYIGELLIEGPLVGQGYLDDPEKSSNAFIERPRWLLRDHCEDLDNLSRIYKTGDLVKYNENGSLSYVGRKDAQVKIRGQRVELGEVETQVQRYLPDARRVVAEVIVPQAARPTAVLVVFIQSNKHPAISDEVKLVQVPSNIEKMLAEYLPTYMVPAAFIFIGQLPMTPTGKMNRRRLREIGATFSMNQFMELQTVESGAKRRPSTNIELSIQKVWSEVLNIDPGTIGIDDSFFQMGGDSITAMQVASSVARLSIHIRVADILREKTIFNIAKLANTVENTTTYEASKSLQKGGIGSTHLSPMQRLYFQLQKDPTVCFDQFFFLKLRRKITFQSVSDALETIVRRHDILRTRFRQNDTGIWEQRIDDDDSQSFSLGISNSSDSKSTSDAISHCRARLDIKQGPLLSAVLFDNSSKEQALFIDIHHLVIDLVSWRVILGELEDLMTGGNLITPPPSIDFMSWNIMQAQYAGEKLKVDSFNESNSQANLAYWGMSNTVANTRDGIITKSFVVDQETSSIILDAGNKALNTRPHELIISALVYSFGREFHDRPLPAVFSEGHGREVWDDNIDISTTIGWFSTISPIQITAGANYSLKDVIRLTKDAARSLQKNGWVYFTSRFRDQVNSGKFAQEYPVEMMFNYAGIYQQLERSDGLFEYMSIPDGCDPQSCLGVRRFALFDIDTRIDKGRIVSSIEFHKDMHRKDKIVQWIRNFEISIRDMALELFSMSPDWTLSDYPLAFNSYDSLYEFRKFIPQLGIQPEDIEDIYPCAPLQEGILASQARETANYQRWVELEVRVDGKEARLDIDKLTQAWQTVVKRHPLLRAVLIDTAPGISKMMHVILKDPTPCISLDRVDTGIATGLPKYGLQHRLTIYDIDEKKAHLRLEMNHAITDGISQNIVYRDLQSAYSSVSLSPAGSYKYFISYLEEQSHGDSQEFWTRNLLDIEPCHLPVSTAGGDETYHKPTRVPDINSSRIREFCAIWEVTPATVIQTAWALVLRAYTGISLPCFGNLVSGRDVPVHGVDHTFGPFIGLVPFRIQLNQSDTVLETLRQAQDNYLSILPHQHFPLSQIHRSLGLGPHPLFNTVLSFQKIDGHDSTGGTMLQVNEISNFDPTEYDITIDVIDSGAEIDILLTSRPGSLTLQGIHRLADCISVAVSEIIRNPNQNLQAISLISKFDLQKLQQWNGTLPGTADQCVHEIIEERVKAYPDAQAISSWDGDLTYGELDRLANGLANRLVELGIRQNMLIPLCFEKSLWTSVAILAVLKVGSAFALLDTSLPEQRLQAIVKQIEAKIILSSAMNLSLSSRLCERVEQVGADFTATADTFLFRKPQSPTSAIFAIFTSGSTGVPKAAVLTHVNISTSLKHQVEILGFTKESRVYDFASYAFDISVHNQVATFTTGGCLCIPSDDDRKNNIAGSMKAMRATIITITPSVARLIEPSSVPDLKTLIIGGEIITASDAVRWWGQVHVVNIYGPAECHISTINAEATKPEEIAHIGRGVGLLTWVVDPQNHNSLLPIGCVGELVLEGPLVGQGYIKEPEKTAAAFIQTPTWLRHFNRNGRMYKTGDLVHYNEDGTLTFLGRKDTQVKIRGQRVELGEIEYRVEECFPESSQVAVEVIKPSGHKVLAAFIQTETGPMSAKILPIPPQVKHALSNHLPHHMIPTVFFTMNQLPMTATGKANRRSLREIGASLSAEEVAEMQTNTQSPKRLPTTEIEHLMRKIWSRVLGIRTESIGLDDGFFQLGGDSINAMKVVAESRKLGFQLTVADIFNHDTLQHISRQCLKLPDSFEQLIPPFHLISNRIDVKLLIEDITVQHQFKSSILDIYPCTPLQEGLFSLSLKRSGDYIMQATLELSPGISTYKFRKAWEDVFRSIAILRTRIVQTSLGLQQVVLDEQIEWLETVGLEDYLHLDRNKPMEIGMPLNRYAVIQDTTGVAKWFVWTIHHVLYDGWSEPILIEAVEKAYQGQKFDIGPPFQMFMKYIKTMDNTTMQDYWRNALNSIESSLFPTLPPSVRHPSADESIDHLLPHPQNQIQNVTISTLIRAAWALVAGKMTDSKDVIFGVTVSGRTAPVADIEKLIAPTIATIPIRIIFSNDQTVGDFMREVQQQSIEMIPYEQLGLQQIAKISAPCQHACNFQTLLVIQPQESNTDNLFGRWINGDQARWFNTYGLVLVAQITSESITMKANFDSRIIDPWVVRQMLRTLEYVIFQLGSVPQENTLHSIEMVSPADLGQISRWNSNLPVAADQSVHEIIAGFAQTQPEAAAICAWDGDFSYKELDELSTKLAAYLLKIGAAPKRFVSIFFEKSKWNTIAMLAVMKSGASFVLLDPSLPTRRLKAMIQEVEAKFIITSFLNKSMSESLCQNVVTIDSTFFNTLDDESISGNLDLDGINYVVFTSGTTGNPKGATITHRNSASAVKYQVPGFGYTTESRVYDFSTYSFDGAHFNAFTVLAAGGCLCVPTDQDRKNNLAESMEALRANTIFLTPTVAELLSPTQLPHLKSMILGGEAIRVKDIKKWWGIDGVRIFTLYGTSECTPVSMINPFPATPEAAIDIGRGYGVLTWIVDPDNHDHLVPLGCVGELLVEGPLVGTGYINNPTKTAAAFIKDPVWMVQAGRTGSLYKTGDLVRYNKDGSLKFVGRKDAQVKIRGQRVELGDVECLVQDYLPDATRVAVEVVTPQGDNSSPMLVAFLQIDKKAAATDSFETTTDSTASILSIPTDVEESLSQSLPSYMIPTVFLAMRMLPLGTTGKMNRKRLQEIGSLLSLQQLAETRSIGAYPKRQPRTNIEHQLQKLWSNVLNIEPASMIGLDDSFFKLGGNSITAMKAVGEARKCGLQLTVADIFRYPKLYQTAEHVSSLQNDSPMKIIGQDELSDSVEQSFAQGRLWFLEQLYPGLTWYLMPCVMRLEGPLDINALNAALISLERRHESLRTIFFTLNGVNMQKVLPVRVDKNLCVIPFPSDDERGLMDALRKDETTPFDLEKQPGWRTVLYKTGEEQYVLSIVMHHIISDGWSVDILRKELTSFYSAAIRGIEDPLSEVDPLPIQYRHFSIWEKKQASEHERQLEYWATQLEASRPAEMICDKPRPNSLSGCADVERFYITGPIYEELQRFCHDHNITPFITLLAAFRATHYRLTGQRDATIGSPNANRDRWETKDVIGFFVNMQCLRIKIEEDALSFNELIKQVQAATIASFANQDIPFERIVSKLQHSRDLSRHPLVQIVFAVHSQLDLGQFTFEGIRTQYVDQSLTSRFDLECHFFQEQEGLRCEILYSTDLFANETIKSLASVFNELLKQVLEEPITPIASVNLLADGSLALLNEKGTTGTTLTDDPCDLSVVEVFRQQVIAFPEKLALKDTFIEYTYAELDEKSDVIARWLARRSLAPETLISVYASRSCDTIITFLGILKANLAYLPFDSKTPAGRMENILASVNGSDIVLIGRDIKPPHLHRDVEFILIEEILGDKMTSENPIEGRDSSPSSLAYVMFTSGSTGQPKGVMIEHHSIVQLVKNTDMLQHSIDAPMAHMSNIAFDASTWEIYATLLNGGTLICIDTITSLDYEAVSKKFMEDHIRAAFITPALLKQYLNECPDTIRVLETLYIGGDRLDTEDVLIARSLMRSDAKIINGYGPTENTSFSTMYILPADEPYTNGVPIGQALRNSGAYVMDSQQRLVPLGVIGELVVTGGGLARGYTDPRQNLNRFITISLDRNTQVKAYRTGDYARNRPLDGLIEYFGRSDGQIKVNSQRVELEEIEHVLRSHKSVADAATVLQEEEGCDAQLVGFISLQKSSAEVYVQNTEQESGNESEQVDSWEELFNNDTYDNLDNLPSISVGRDFVGWSSMYTGSDIDTGEMNEWLDDTIKSIINGSTALDVLELGSGSGMILFNLASDFNSYVGIEPTEKAINWVNRSARAIPGLADKIYLHKGAATDISQLGLISPNIVIVNSVAQYFPSNEYLLKIITDILRLKSVATIFFGDIRSYAMYKEFQVTKALFLHGNKVSKEDVRHTMSDTEQSEIELLVDPSFFTALPTQFPELIYHVEIIPKIMHATNELSCYRYAAVIHVKGNGPKTEIHEVGKDEWVDFEEQQLNRETLSKLLQCSTGSVAISNIPYRKTILERTVIESLNDNTYDDSNWLVKAADKAKERSSLAAVDLEEVARQTGRRVEISWARQYSQHGGLDAIFHFNELGQRRRTLFRFPTDNEGRPLRTLSSQPLQQQIKHRIREQLQKKLEAQLLSYMVPKIITFLDKMPINDNGKVDRRALAHNVQKRTTRRGVLNQPTTKVEKQMQGIWAKILKLNPATISVTDNFFGIGGDSLAAMKVVGEARRAGLKLTVADIFRGFNLQKIASKVVELEGATHNIPKTNTECPVEQSFAQRRIWFLEQLYPGLTWYLMPCAIRLRGDLNIDALRVALLSIESRHDTLRTTFKTIDNIEMQVIRPLQSKDLPIIDVLSEEALTQALQKDQTTPIDLSMEPGWKVALYRLGGDDRNHVLSIVMHHIISDGWSLEILQKELAMFYRIAARKQDPLSEVEALPIQYRDFSLWQKSKEQIQEHKQQLNYWVKQLQTSQAAEFFCDKPRPAALSGQAGVQSLRLEGEIYDRLQMFCKMHKVTPFIVLLAVFRATHFRLTGVIDANIGTTNANRHRWEVRELIGFFVNLQSIRIRIENESLEELIQQVHRTTTESFANQDVPFENVVSKLQKDRDLSRQPLSQIIFAIHSQMNLGSFNLEGLHTEQISAPPTTRFDMELHFFQEVGALQGEVLFSTDLYVTETIANMLSVFYKILEYSLKDPRVPIISLPLLKENDLASLERMGLINTGHSTYNPHDATIVDLFQQQVALHPKRIAVRDSSPMEFTYTELDRITDNLAAWLNKYAFVPETLIGVYCNRSCQSVVAFLGILKAGLAYLPFHLKTPGSRMETILSSLPGRKVILVGSEVNGPSVHLQDVEFIRIADALEEQSRRNSEPRRLPIISAASLAYVMFTSGSTGRPKGVMVNHRGIIRLVRESDVLKHLPPNVIMAHLTNIAFDVSAWEMYAALLNGGTLVCVDTANLLDPRALTEIFIREDIQSASFTPALLKIVLEQAPTALGSLEVLYVAGDKADSRDLATARRSMKGKVVINAYGPTENSVFSTIYVVPEEEKCTNGVPIGRAVSNSGAYIVDKHQHLVPIGVIGELVVTGDGLAIGYTDPHLDVGRFITLTIQGKQLRGYRTGDYARWRPIDGVIEFLGRVDGQVKIRGHRVELGEIEHILKSHRAVKDAAVVLKHDESQEPQILGFVATNRDIETNTGENSGTLEHVKVWEELFDTETYQAVDQMEPGKLGRDFIGWSSNYDGSMIDATEMNEWLDDTMVAIQNSGKPLRVLEIGTGTGMVLFNLPSCLIEYTGLEPSERAVEFVLKSAESIPTLSSKVRMYKGTAADISKLPSTVSPNMVIINSVSQYFPSHDYLLMVVENIINLGNVETIFFGDIRSHALYREFHASKILLPVGEAIISKDEVHQRMAELERMELELLIDPAFFTSLKIKVPEIEHVEILPKNMHATNELSCYRYGAVLHIRSNRQRQIHVIEDNEWIDFKKEKFDKESLLKCLQRAKSNIVAISNIPYSKTIFEKFALESLDNGLDDHDWVSTSRRLAQRCPSLAPIDLIALARANSLRVEISWARQYSQRGGLDAIFHPPKPEDSDQSRVLFAFPTEQHDRQPHLLASHPLRQQLNQRVRKNLDQLLQAELPPYMIPQTITILEKMPVNDNGKVDRKALSAIHNTPTATLGRVIRKPNSDTERMMQRVWGQVLSIDCSAIGLHDNFFHLGGNSITAMRVISEVRKLGLKLVVADVFNFDTLERLASRCMKASQEYQEVQPAVLIEPNFKSALMKEIDTLNLGFHSSAVADILPLTNFQNKTIIHGIWAKQYANYFYLNIGANLDVEKFKAGSTLVLQKFPILRARFLRLDGKFWQVILHNHSDLAPIQTHYVKEDLFAASNAYCKKDLQRLTAFELPLAFILLRHETEGSQLIVRLSHAQYDGISFPIILQSLMDAYNGVELLPAPDFSRYLSYSSQKREISIAYWKSLLYGSSPTIIEPKLLLQGDTSRSATPKRIHKSAEVQLPQLPTNITSAALVSAAWAILLSRISGQSDVVYGSVVTGRNSAFQGIENIVGACLNIIPIRVTFSSLKTATQLLRSIQEQFFALGEADSLGFKEIIDHCTDWPVGSDFDAVIQHQNIEEHPEIKISDRSSKVDFYSNSDIIPPSLFLISYPKGKMIDFQLFANTNIMSTETASDLLQNLCQIVRAFDHQQNRTLQPLLDTFI